MSVPLFMVPSVSTLIKMPVPISMSVTVNSQGRECTWTDHHLESLYIVWAAHKNLRSACYLDQGLSGIKKLPLILKGKTTYSVTCYCYMVYLYSCSVSGSFWIRGSLVPGIPGQSLICDLDLDRSRVCRRVAKVHQSHRGGARVRMRVRSHWGRAAWLRQSCGSGSGQRELHMRLSVASLHFVFSFFQHRGLKMKCLWNFYIDTLASFILRYYLKLLYKFTLNLILVFNRQ